MLLGPLFFTRCHADRFGKRGLCLRQIANSARWQNKGAKPQQGRQCAVLKRTTSE
jgi:hypothetical protein